MTLPTKAPCSCGSDKDHEIARRATADGSTVCLWSSGALTGRLGYALEGVPLVRPKTPDGVAREIAAAWMLLGDVALYDVAEVPALYAACRWAARRGLSLADARARFARDQRPKLKPHWEVYQRDRHGRATLRVWRLPRLLWPGLGVWDHCGQAGTGSGRYQLVRVDRHGVCIGTGFRFANQAALAAHLHGARLGPTASSTAAPAA